MALVKKQSNSSRFILFIVAGAIVVVIGYVLYNQLIANTAGSNVNTGVTGRPTIITNFNQAILRDPRYLNLRSFGSTPTLNLGPDDRSTDPFR